jgi:hypothetical protein
MAARVPAPPRRFYIALMKKGVHVALRVDETYYEVFGVGGFLVFGQKIDLRISDRVSDEYEVSFVVEDRTSLTVAQMKDKLVRFSQQWQHDHPDYDFTNENCHMFVRDLVEFVTDKRWVFKTINREFLEASDIVLPLGIIVTIAGIAMRIVGGQH